MAVLAVATMFLFVSADTADARWRGGGFYGGGFRGYGGPRFYGGGARFYGGPRFYAGPRIYRGGFYRPVGVYRPAFRPVYAGYGWRRSYWRPRPYWGWRRPWVAPVVVGAGFYGGGWYGSCWRWRFTPWGWRRVNVCGYPVVPYWRAAYPWGW
ncbi:hypothetical protein [Rhodoplanes azumiensis]|uniref:Sulfur globule protein n=1 Tax=Rhodoplanes azumiensis TaxID=1897628 RepID=A0ABW5ANQ8_9BRAD